MAVTESVYPECFVLRDQRARNKYKAKFPLTSDLLLQLQENVQKRKEK